MVNLILLLSQVTAIRAEKVIPVSGPDIADGVVLIRDGKIEAVGAKLEVPAGARVIEVGAVMPGLVHPYARTGLVGSGGSPDATAANVLNPLDEGFSALASRLILHMVGIPDLCFEAYRSIATGRRQSGPAMGNLG